MATVTQRNAADLATNGKGEAIAELILDVAQFFSRLRVVGQKRGLVTNWGGGTFSFLRSLATTGPLTVPQIASMRPTRRQRMQRLADELAAEGLIEFIDNPRHRRSKLLRLTRKGSTRYRALSASFLEFASALGTDLREDDIRKAAVIVRQLSDEASAGHRSPRKIGPASDNENGIGFRRNS